MMLARAARPRPIERWHAAVRRICRFITCSRSGRRASTWCFAVLPISSTTVPLLVLASASCTWNTADCFCLSYLLPSGSIYMPCRVVQRDMKPSSSAVNDDRDGNRCRMSSRYRLAQMMSAASASCTLDLYAWTSSARARSASRAYVISRSISLRTRSQISR